MLLKFSKKFQNLHEYFFNINFIFENMKILHYGFVSKVSFPIDKYLWVKNKEEWEKIRRTNISVICEKFLNTSCLTINIPIPVGKFWNLFLFQFTGKIPIRWTLVLPTIFNFLYQPDKSWEHSVQISLHILQWGLHKHDLKFLFLFSF